MYAKGFTLIEALFALMIILCVYCVLYPMIIQSIASSRKIDSTSYYQIMEDSMGNQFYPVEDLESTLEEIIENY